MVGKFDHSTEKELMPFSNETGKKEIKAWFDDWMFSGGRRIVVDFGCGAATYPKLLGKKGIHWIGIEIWEPYVDEFNLQEWYDVLIIGDLRSMLWPPGDCAIFGDVLEHLTKEDAVRTIKKADLAYRNIVIAIPIYNSQGPTENPHEEHLHWWLFDEMQAEIPSTFALRMKIGDPALVPAIPLMGVFIK